MNDDDHDDDHDDDDNDDDHGDDHDDGDTKETSSQNITGHDFFFLL